MISGIADLGQMGVSDSSAVISGGQEISNSFLYLLLVQGFFNGLIIGKLAEGNAKAGIKHSFILMFSAFLISAVASLFLG